MRREGRGVGVRLSKHPWVVWGGDRWLLVREELVVWGV